MNNQQRERWSKRVLMSWFFLILSLLMFVPKLTWRLLWMNAAEVSIVLHHKLSVVTILIGEIGVVCAIILLISYNGYLLDRFVEKKVL